MGTKSFRFCKGNKLVCVFCWPFPTGTRR